MHLTKYNVYYYITFLLSFQKLLNRGHGSEQRQQQQQQQQQQRQQRQQRQR